MNKTTFKEQIERGIKLFKTVPYIEMDFGSTNNGQNTHWVDPLWDAEMGLISFKYKGYVITLVPLSGGGITFKGLKLSDYFTNETISVSSQVRVRREVLGYFEGGHSFYKNIFKAKRRIDEITQQEHEKRFDL